MTLVYGYAGKILNVNLTTSEINEDSLSEDFCRKYVGGAGFAGFYMLSKMQPGIDPFDPESCMCIATGPMAGTFMPSATKAVCSIKGPAGFYVSSPTSNFGRYLKHAGYDGIVITGRSERPVYLDIFNDDIRFRDASHVWGRGIFEATDIIKEETRDAAVACIGPAGENLVAYANILVNRQGTWCRSGDGAIMGSKNLKAIAVNGTKGVKVADPERFKQLAIESIKKLKSNPLVPLWNELGLLIGWDAWMVNTGKSVTDNFSNTAPSDMMTELYGPKAFNEQARARSSHCHTCPVGCKSAVEIKSGEFAGLKHIQSTIFSAIESFGAKARVGGYNHLIKCAHTINEYGIDNLTFCAKMDLLCNLYDKGIIDLKDTAGWVPRRGFQSTMELMEMVAFRRGVGELIAGTWQDTTERLAKGRRDYVVHMKGTDPANDLRTHICTENFGQLVCARGGHNMNALSITIVPHRKLNSLKKFAKWIGIPEAQVGSVVPNEIEVEYVPRLTKWVEDYNVMLLNLSLCNRPPYQQIFSPDVCAELFEVTTGIEISPQEVLQSGERAQNLERQFNSREGFDRKEDQPPPKWTKEPTFVDGRKIEALSQKDVDSMLDRYYEERGWDRKGVPTPQTLDRLKIGNL
jgi:aldehyde:ferredoxin oxidoreductase